MKKAWQQREWRPLLEGELADQAWAAIRAIAGEIPAYPLSPGKVTSDAWGLAGGAAGSALFYAYLAAATGEESFEERALADLEGALDCAAAQPWRLGLWQGLLGRHLELRPPGRPALRRRRGSGDAGERWRRLAAAGARAAPRRITT